MSDKLIWQRVETAAMFCTQITGKHLTGGGLEFVIYPNGRISGTADGQKFSGSWVWRDGFFCRKSELDGEDLGLDCEVIEISDGRMRYTRDKGMGDTAIVEIGKIVPG
ncbi:dihydrodipicolinate reductase [Sedimentitalea todarodis]|uniref:Dihydrodipicolinate reductase n=1 Tax=Sedimentitalea todarodis TaxID=1631240 RepID=A0ABU3VL51_9RHOB|nr:dihydrodipicolinate reductase [Sedimentitalea todarodis]MDU9006903.1 dihydrodipicolinate reductase [Sedimentitalea todarodis]